MRAYSISTYIKLNDTWSIEVVSFALKTGYVRILMALSCLALSSSVDDIYTGVYRKEQTRAMPDRNPYS